MTLPILVVLGVSLLIGYSWHYEHRADLEARGVFRATRAQRRAWRRGWPDISRVVRWRI